MIVRIRETEQLQEQWKEGVICPIYKKGDKLDCENYRAIAVLNTAYKVLSQILFRRLSPITNRFMGSYQAGFMDGRLTTDQIRRYANPPKMSGVQSPNAPSFHRLQIGIRHDRPKRAMENHGRKWLPWEAD